MKNKLIIGLLIFLTLGVFLLFFTLSGNPNGDSQKYEDFVATAGETWNNVAPFRYTKNSCEDWFIELGIGNLGELDYCFIKDFEVRYDSQPSTINCRCWLR